MSTRMWEIKGSIEDAIHCLDDAVSDLDTVSAECDDKWAAITETRAKVAAVLEQARTLLPMHPEIQAEIDREEDEADRYEDWLASGNHPGL